MKTNVGYVCGLALVALAAAVLWIFRDRDGQASGASREPVGIASKEDVLQLLGEGKKVVFVDAREPREFAEGRIPGAVNVALRDVSTLPPSLLEDADLVIAYCLKDFRGYEVARALGERGVRHVATMDMPGLNGWKAAGLPVANAEVDDASALERLIECARSGECGRKNDDSI